MKIINQIIKGDNLKIMSQIQDNYVNLTITSPPYRNAIDYSMHTKHGNNSEKNYRGKLKISIKDYVEHMKKTFREVNRITVDGGFCCIIIGNEINNGTLEPLPALITRELVRQNWFLHEEIIWHKVTGGANRAGSFIQHPYPSYFRANIMHEKILMFRKGKRKLRRDIRYAFKDMNAKLFKEIANSVWHIAPVPPGYLDHPCPYPEEIPHRLVNLYSYPNDVILDPFNGSGQTTKVAKHLRRKFIGIDVYKKYVQLAKKRLKEPLNLRHESLTLEFDEKNEIPHWKKIPTWDENTLISYK